MERNKECSHLCQCVCHGEDSMVMHFAPCCAECKICGQRIKSGHMAAHLLGCHPISSLLKA